MTKYEMKMAIILFAVIVSFPFISNSYFLLRMLTFIGIYALVAVGLSLLMCYTGQVSIGHAGFMAIGAYTSAILTTQYAWSPWLSMGAAIFLTLAISFLIGVTCLRLTGHYLAMATLGLGLIINNLIVELSDLTGGVRGIAGIPSLSIFGYELSSDIAMYYLIWAVVLISVWLSCNMINSSLGRALKSIKNDEIAAVSFGINVKHYKLMIFLISTSMAAVAGCLMGHFMTFVGPDPFSLFSSIMFLMMALIGGDKSPLGAIFGAIIIGGLPQLFATYQDFSGGMFGLLLLLVMLFLPHGVLNVISLKKLIKQTH